MVIAERKWKRQPGWGIMKWRGWRVAIDNLLIQRGEMLPRGYGVAWREWDRDCVVVMPIPVNVFASWVRRAWHWLKHGVKLSAYDSAVIEAYHRGHTDGSNSRLAEFRRQEDRVRMESYEKGRQDALMAVELTMELHKIKDGIQH